MKLYLDNAATTEIHPEVIKSITECYSLYYGNPSSVHKAGYESRKRIDSARELMLSTVNAKNHHLIYTSGGTESNNLAILGTTNSHQKQTSQYLCSEIEHPSVIRVYDQLKHEGVNVSYLPVTKEGILDINTLKNSVTTQTHIVSIMHVNNETGIIQPVEEAINIIKEMSPNTLIHVDGVQAYGKIDVDLNSLKADFYSLSAHKIGGPKGVGALIIKKDVRLTPIMWGGGQESGLRPGTENAPGIVGFEKAARLYMKHASENMKRMWEVRKELVEHMTNLIEGIAVIEHNDKTYQYPGILTVLINKVKSEVILRMLSDDGIYLSAGSACSSRNTSASHVLKAMKLNNTAMDGVLRISFNQSLTHEQVVYFVQKLEKYVNQMRKMVKR